MMALSLGQSWLPHWPRVFEEPEGHARESLPYPHLRSLFVFFPFIRYPTSVRSLSSRTL